MRTTSLLLLTLLAAVALLVACGGAPPEPPTCGVEGLPCCVDDGSATTCEAGLTCGGGTPGTCSRVGAMSSALMSVGGSTGDIAPPACSDVGAECCPSPSGGYCSGWAYGFPLVCYRGECWVSVGPPPIPGYRPITIPAKK